MLRDPGIISNLVENKIWRRSQGIAQEVRIVEGKSFKYFKRILLKKRNFGLGLDKNFNKN